MSDEVEWQTKATSVLEAAIIILNEQRNKKQGLDAFFDSVRVDGLKFAIECIEATKK